MSPAVITRPLDRLISEPDAATAQCALTTPPEVSIVANAAVPPAALVSLVMAFAVMTPPEAAGKAVALNVSVAHAVAGALAVEPVMRKTSLPDGTVPTRSATELRNVVVWVVDIA